MTTIAISIEDDTLERIDRVAAGQKGMARKRSQVIREAIREYLNRAERMAEEEREREIIGKHRGRQARQAAALVREQARS